MANKRTQKTSLNHHLKPGRKNASIPQGMSNELKTSLVYFPHQIASVIFAIVSKQTLLFRHR